MKKVLFVINNLGRGGAERVFVNQVNFLHQQGVPVYLCLLLRAPEDSFESELKLPADRVFKLNGSPLDISYLFRTLNTIVKQQRIEIVYSTLELPNILNRLLKILHPRLWIVTREGSAVIDAKGRVAIKPVKFRFLDLVLNILADRIIAVSEEIELILKSYLPHCCRKIVKLENGIAVAQSKEQVQAQVGAKAGRLEFRVLAAASMNYHERAFEYLIDAIALLPDELKSRTVLTFAGDGRLRPKYEAQVEKLHLSSHIKFLGRISTAELQEEYKKADTFVLCSTSEGSPNVILEAGSYGLPVVTTRVGSATSMVKDGETGFFIPFRDSQAIADKLIWLADHEGERLKMGLKAYDHIAEHFSFTTKLKKLTEILHIST